MLATISGMVCAIFPEGAKDKDEKFIPITHIYSDGEIVKIRGLLLDQCTVGSFVDVPCKIMLKDWQGQKYISVQFVDRV